MTRVIFLKYTAPKTMDHDTDNDIFSYATDYNPDGFELLPPSAIKDCPCSQFMELHGRYADEVHQLKRIITEKDAEINRLRHCLRTQMALFKMPCFGSLN